jgi:hypothetical protein
MSATTSVPLTQTVCEFCPHAIHTGRCTIPAFKGLGVSSMEQCKCKGRPGFWKRLFGALDNAATLTDGTGSFAPSATRISPCATADARRKGGLLGPLRR